MTGSTHAQGSPFSLFDADLPLLAVDAAAEIDQIIPAVSSSGDEIQKTSLEYTKELLERLSSISSNQAEINVDSIMYEQSFLPTLEGKGEMFQEPMTLKGQLDELLSRHSKLVDKDATQFLTALRDFFLEVSAFSSSSRRMLRIGSNPHPNATL